MVNEVYPNPLIWTDRRSQTGGAARRVRLQGREGRLQRGPPKKLKQNPLRKFWRSRSEVASRGDKRIKKV